MKIQKSILILLFAVFFANFVGSLSAQPLLDVIWAENKQRWDAPMVIEPGNNYSPKNRKFTGIPAMAIAPGGRMWATWYSGINPDEDHHNYVVLATSGDSGNTWEEMLIVDPDGEGPLRGSDPMLWLAPDNSLYFFYTIGGRRQTPDPYDTWFMKTDDPDNKNAVWSAQRFLASGMMNTQPTALASGEWLFPVALCGDGIDKLKSDHDNSAKVYISRDKGATVDFLGACNIPATARAYDEHQIVERKDGSLWMLARTTYGIGESVSTDKGKTWSELQPSKIMHPSARFFITRLLSGNLLLVKHGPINVNTNRTHLMAFISKDDGLTWSNGLLLDQGSNTSQVIRDHLGGKVSYPNGQQTKDGRIYMIYDYNRLSDQLILKTNFTEADILDPHSDEAILRVHNNRKVVTHGGQ